MHMSSRKFRNVLLLVLVAPALVEAAAPASNSQCNRECLTGFVDRYLTALKARNPAGLPVAAQVKFTENTVRLALGEGLWQTITGIEPYKLYIADPAAGQVGYFGVITEHGKVNVFALRLKIEAGAITQIETAVSRNNPFIEPTNLKAPRPGLLTAVAPAERSSRAEMVRAANQYFEGIEQATDKVVPFADECTRMENGVLTAGAASGGLKPRSDGELVDCKTQFRLGAFYATSVAPRRFEIVDEERGLVLGVVALNVPATRTSLKLSDGTTKRAADWALMPFSGPLIEVFKIRNGKIYEIEAVMMPLLPYKIGTGWE
jgi:hypothetical protein